MAYDICLHPDIIDEVIEDLFAIDVISQDQLKHLKNDATLADPNIMMDVRHKEVKQESLIDFVTNRKAPELLKMKIESISKESKQKVKDLKTIDKEILNTRKYLEEFQIKLEKKSECLINSILDLEKKKEDLEFEEKMKEDERDSPVVVKLNEQETSHYFNLHLDRLENNMNQNQQKDSIKTWRPIEVKSPVINVVTTFNNCDVRSTSLKDTEEEIQLLQMFDLKPFYITGKSLETPPEIQTVQTNVVVPNNSPIFNVSVTLEDKNKLSSKQIKIMQKVIKTWKLYAKKKKIQKWSEGKASKLRIYLLKKYVSLWISYTKYSRDAKETSTSSGTLEIVPAKCVITQKTFGVGNLHVKADSDKHQELNKLNIDQVQNKSPANKKNKVEITAKKVVIASKGNKDKCSQNNPENTLDKTEIHVKTLTPQDVGLVQLTNTNMNQSCKQNLGKRTLEAKDSMTSRSMGEPLIHRFEAQEKIIKQQRELIEKQSRIIFDLQAKCLEIESKLNWTLAERQLAEAESQVKNGSVSCDNKLVRKLETKHSKPIAYEGYNIKNQDKSDIIVKNMLERQAYCSQLAEQTKMRKIRIEEEKERLRLEQGEKQRQEKEEEKRKRLLQIKMEQQIAQEKQRNAIVFKKIEEELVGKANEHYRNKLLCRSFDKLKLICLEVLVKSEDCDRIYRQKITRKMFNIWKGKVKHSIQSKYEFAERYYSERLIRMAWDSLCKVHQDYKLRLQVSEDLYNLKLQERMFRRWQAYTAQQFLQQCCKVELAEHLHRRQLLRHYFYHWKELPKLMFKEREKEQRRRAWRHTVQQLIPDFTPAYVDEI